MDTHLKLLFPISPRLGQPLADAAIGQTARVSLDRRLGRIFLAGLRLIAILDSPAWMACSAGRLGAGTEPLYAGSRRILVGGRTGRAALPPLFRLKSAG